MNKTSSSNHKCCGTINHQFPFAILKPDTLDRFFHGTNHMNQKKTHTAQTLASTDKFATYIDSLSWDAQNAIETEFKQRILNFNQDDALGYACADLFLQIMDNICEGNETPNPILCIHRRIMHDKHDYFGL